MIYTNPKSLKNLNEKLDYVNELCGRILSDKYTADHKIDCLRVLDMTLSGAKNDFDVLLKQTVHKGNVNKVCEKCNLTLQRYQQAKESFINSQKNDKDKIVYQSGYFDNMDIVADEMWGTSKAMRSYEGNAKNGKKSIISKKITAIALAFSLFAGSSAVAIKTNIDKDKISQAYSEAINEKEQAERNYQIILSEKGKLEKQLESAYKQEDIDRLNDKIASLNEEIRGYINANDVLAKKVETYEKANEDLTKRVESLENDNQDLANILTTLHIELNDALDNYRASLLKIDDLEKQLRDALNSNDTSSLAGLQKQLEEANKENKRLQGELNGLTVKYNTLVTTAETLENENADLKEQLKLMTGEERNILVEIVAEKYGLKKSVAEKLTSEQLADMIYTLLGGKADNGYYNGSDGENGYGDDSIEDGKDTPTNPGAGGGSYTPGTSGGEGGYDNSNKDTPESENNGGYFGGGSYEGGYGD